MSHDSRYEAHSHHPRGHQAGLHAKRRQKLNEEIAAYARANAGSPADLDTILEAADIEFFRDGQPDLEWDDGFPD
jgi:hypothetical protein